nr:hypothetical protein [Candidatus Levybacteria bacterium]
MPARAEQPQPESALQEPLRVIASWEVGIADVEQMARIVGGRVAFSDADFQNVPYLEHPLGIRVRFGEGFTGYGSDLRTTISVDPALVDRSNVGNIVLQDALVKIGDDAVVIKQFGQRMVEGSREDLVDEITITKKDYGYKREFNPS